MRLPKFATQFGIVCVAVCFCGSVSGLAAEAKQAQRIGFDVFTSADDQSIGDDGVVIRYDGPIVFPMAENLSEIWAELRGKFKTVVLELNSGGGLLSHAESVIAILKQMRGEVVLRTLVRQGQACLSACVPVYMQGEERIAGNATSWMFHGPCRPFANTPSPDATRQYLEMLRDAGATEEFLCAVTEQGRFSSLQEFWVSGYELYHQLRANVITRLLDSWQSQIVIDPPFDPLKKAR